LAQEETGVNMASSQTLSSFISRSLAAYPAAATALVLWGHGQGWRGLGGDHGSSVGLGGGVPAALSLPQLTEAVRTGLAGSGGASVVFDLLALDASLMQSYTVASSLAPHARYLLGSQLLQPASGWDYKELVQALAADTTPQALGTAVADQYTARADAEHLSRVTMSLLKAEAVRMFDVAMEEWATAARAALSGATAQALLLRLATARATAVEMVNAPGFELIDLGALLRTLHHVCTPQQEIADAALIDFEEMNPTRKEDLTNSRLVTHEARSKQTYFCLGVVLREVWSGRIMTTRRTTQAEGSSGGEAEMQAAGAAHAAYDSMVLHRAGDEATQHVTGVSVWWPQSTARWDAERAAFCAAAAAAAWCDFLRDYHAALAAHAATPLAFDHASEAVQVESQVRRSAFNIRARLYCERGPRRRSC
jgi:hypothetical protein